MKKGLWMFLLVGLAIGFGQAAVFAEQPAKRPVKIDDFARLKAVGDPQLSPDGKWVAYTVGTIDLEKDKRDTDLWMVSWDGKEEVRLTSSPDGESRPRWSPDNRTLAFLASRGDEDQKKKGSQVWLLDRRGGEAQRLTDIKGGISDYAWSPDGKRLVLVVSDPNPDDEPEQKEGWKRKTKPPILIDRYHFKEDRQGYLGNLHEHLWVFDLEAGKGEALTSGAFDDRAPAWSPDGRSIAFVSNRAPDPDRSGDSNVYVIEAKAGAELRPVTTFAGPDGGRPAWSPDGQWIAYFQGDEPRFYAYHLNKLAVVPAAGGPARVLTAALDRAVEGPVLWTADGQSLIFVVEDDRASYVGRIAAAGGDMEKVSGGRRVVSSLSLGSDGKTALLTATAVELPEVHALENGALRRLSRQNEAWLSEVQLGTTEDFTSKSKDGTIVNSLLVKPAGFKPGQKYPLLLFIHGGPNGQDEHSFSFDQEVFAAQGYVVLAVNYRGSSGRGSAFQKAIYADWCHKEVIDLIGAVDEAIRSGVADPNRLGLGGWSYGGILTDATIAVDQRFKAGVSGAGSSLQLTMYGTDQYILQYEQELGPPWKGLEPWLKVSAAFLSADRIKTPTLFMCGEKDFNVPIAGSEQMYEALKSRGIDTQLVVYPGQFHGITTPSYVRDRMERRLAWYNKYLKPAGEPPS
ncbi:MAG: peptidase S9 [Candidatus Aminicenantes bacterium RBG_19FT_COMBO_58_17]|nr:MAG: peptidase S9 [Candidatus Aminicenantes bacterium RBG_19FT_COMBO_58_17]